MADKIDSSITGLSIAEEESLKVLPTTPVWYELEPNSYSDFGGDISTVARTPINASRQRKKGAVVDLEANGGFNTDLTQNGLFRLFQGFFFADAREKPSTMPINGTAVPITAVAASDDSFSAASGLGDFMEGHVIQSSGFTTRANNVVGVLSSASSTKLVMTGVSLLNETPSATAKIDAVGFQFPAGDVSIAATASSITMASVATDFTDLGLTPGEWVFLGGDTSATVFALNLPGYGRIKSIAAHLIEFSETTFTAATDAGATKTIQMFFGNVLRNEKDPSLIVRRSYQLERKLGNDDDGVQSEYLEGAIANEMTLNTPLADKVNVDLSFVALDTTYRTGTEGVKTGTRVSALGEDAFNTSSDIYRQRLNIVDPDNLNNAALFAYASDATLAINNNVTVNKAISVLGGFDCSAGDFEVSGTVDAYFSTVAAIQAIRNNADVAYNMITAVRNAGFVVDIPLLSISGGRLNIEKDQPIKVPLENAGFENDLGYTLLVTWFPYLPDVGMAS